MENNFEVNMVPIARCEFPLKNLSNSDPPENPFDINLSISEERLENRKDEPFQYLKIAITVGVDSPLLKAYDVHTQYAGVAGVFIKHGRPFWPIGKLFYHFYPKWDSETDRILTEKSSITKYSFPADYLTGIGLLSHSLATEISNSDNNSVEVGMVLGKENNIDETLPISIISTLTTIKMSEPKTFTPGINRVEPTMDGSNNPLFLLEMEFKDYHPIPFSIYMIDYYYQDPSNPNLVLKGTTESQLYSPDWLKAGKIIERSKMSTARKTENYAYQVKCITEGKSSGGYGFEIVTVTYEFFKYDVGQWVILAKGEEEKEDGDETWRIIPSSELYWKNAVDFLRIAIGED